MSLPVKATMPRAPKLAPHRAEIGQNFDKHESDPSTGGFDARCLLSEILRLDADDRKCWEHFMDSMTHLYSVIDRELQVRHRLSLFDVLLMNALDQSAGGSSSMGELSDVLMLKRSRLTQQIQRLEARGLVFRRTSADDRRRVIAYITTPGRTVVKRAMATYARSVRIHFLSPLSRAQMAAMSDSCRRISDGLKDGGPSAKLGRTDMGPDEA